MNTEALFLFLILLLGLVLCSFLGGNCEKEGFSGKFSGTFESNMNNSSSTSGASTSYSNAYDHYNHYTGSSTQLSAGSTFYGKKGTTATVVANSDGSQSLQILLPGTSQPITFTPQQQSNTPSSVEGYVNYVGNYGTVKAFYGPNNTTATIITTNNGQKAIKVTTSSGTYYYYTSGSQNNDSDSSTQYYGSTGYHIQSPYDMSYQQSNNASAGYATGPQGNTAYYATGPQGNTVAGTVDNGSTNNASAGYATGPQGNTAYYATGPQGNTVAGTVDNDYSSSLPAGIPRSQIPPGQEDLYILKSEIVPPVCPACPTSAACPRQEPCPPCPACARCPEPAFECKKVPNYNAINSAYLPSPILNDFSQFGM